MDHVNLFKNQTHILQLKNNSSLKKAKQSPKKNYIETKYKLKKNI